MAVLVTGAGLVGSLAAARLLSQGEEVTLFDVSFSTDNIRDHVDPDRVRLVRGDVGDMPDLLRTIKDHGIDRIIHTAGLLTSTVRERPYFGVRTNLTGTVNVFEAARLSAIKRVVFCSSNTVYLGIRRRPENDLFKENASLELITERPPSVYAAMKLAAEWLGHSYSEEYGLDVVSLRFAGVFGPWRGLPSGGPSRLLQELIEGTWQGRRVRVGNGDFDPPGTDFVYAKDAAQGAVLAAQVSERKQGVYNISMGVRYSYGELVAAVEHALGRTVELDVFDGSYSGYPFETWAADISAAERDLGFRVEFPLERAVQDYVAWLSTQRA